MDWSSLLGDYWLPILGSGLLGAVLMRLWDHRREDRFRYVEHRLRVAGDFAAAVTMSWAKWSDLNAAKSDLDSRARRVNPLSARMDEVIAQLREGPEGIELAKVETVRAETVKKMEEIGQEVALSAERVKKARDEYTSADAELRRQGVILNVLFPGETRLLANDLTGLKDRDRRPGDTTTDAALTRFAESVRDDLGVTTRRPLFPRNRPSGLTAGPHKPMQGLFKVGVGRGVRGTRR